MKKGWVICKREVWSALVSPAPYCIITGTLLISAFMFFSLLGSFNAQLSTFASLPSQAGQVPPNLNTNVIEGYLHSITLLLVFVIPLLATRFFAEEQKNGVYELLFASPLTSAELVVGKYFGSLAVVAGLLCGAFAYPLLLLVWGNPERAPLFVGMLGVVACGSFFLAAALFCACCTRHYLTAGMSALVVLLTLYMCHSPLGNAQGTLGSLVREVSPLWRLRESIRGVAVVHDGAYFLGGTLFFLVASTVVLEWRRRTV